MSKKTEVQLVFEQHMKELKLFYYTEYQFWAERKWRADFYIDGFKDDQMVPLLVEIEGGAWTRGRHTRGTGFIKDLEKYNMAAKLGYHVLRFTPQQVLTGEAKKFIAEFFAISVAEPSVSHGTPSLK